MTTKATTSKADIKVLLLQLRDDEAMRDQEYRSVLRSGGLKPGQVQRVNGLTEEFNMKQLLGYHMFIVGGSGDYSIFSALPFLDQLTEALRWSLEHNHPVLGSCWGAQYMAHALGGRVVTDPEREEVGSYRAYPTNHAARDPLFFDAPEQFWAQIGHHESITQLPSGAVNLIRSDRCEIQAFTWPGKPVYGIQLHSDLNKQELIERVVHYRDSYAADPALFNAIIDNAEESPYTDNLIEKFIERIVLPRL